MTLRLDNLSVLLAKEYLLKPCCFQVMTGECLVIQGASGAGKSTLLKAIVGLLKPPLKTQGGISLSGKPVENLPAQSRKIGMLFQNPLLFPHLSVGQNIALGMEKTPALRTRKQREYHVNAWLEAVELGHMAHRMPDSLSGGQQARVALARALAANPQAMLLDEPFSALDAPLQRQIKTLTFRHLAKTKVPVILVTHSPSDVPTQHLNPRLYQMRDGALAPDPENRASY